MQKSGFALGIMLVLSGCGHFSPFEPYREVTCFSGARVSLAEAIDRARGGGGRVLDADYRIDEELACLVGEPGAYDITIYQDGRISEVSVNARTGEIGPREPAGVMTALLGEHPFPGSHADMVPMIPRLKIIMPQAIQIAEREGGKAMVAWIEEREGRAGYTVKLVAEGRVRETWIDGETPVS
jgi:uncharacterized membrane protein YkoI